jgi:4-amino-4-deoxychorismate lyase
VTITHRPPVPPAGSAPRTVTAVTLSRGHPSDAFADAPWLLGGVKTLSYVVNVAAVREARRRGADEVVFTTTDGYALEGPTSAILVARGGTLTATPTGGTGVLESVTVAAVFAAARADGRDTAFELVPVSDLYTADGVWLVSSGRGPVLVNRLDDRPLRSDPDLAQSVLRYAGF